MSLQENSHVSIPIEDDRSSEPPSPSGDANAATPRQEQEQERRIQPERRNSRNEAKGSCSCPDHEDCAYFNIVMSIIYIVFLIAVLMLTDKPKAATQSDNAAMILSFFLVAELTSSFMLFLRIQEGEKDFTKWCLIAHWITYFLVIYQIAQLFSVLEVNSYMKLGMVVYKNIELILRACTTSIVYKWATTTDTESQTQP